PSHRHADRHGDAARDDAGGEPLSHRRRPSRRARRRGGRRLHGRRRDADGPAHRRRATAGASVNRPQRSWWPWLLALVALAGGVYWLRAALGGRPTSAAESAKRPPVPVVVATARAGDMPVYLNGLGSVTAFHTVMVKSRVDGQLINVAFQEGQLVHEGDLLAEIDPRPFQVQLEQAEGQLARDQAQLDDAKRTLARYRELRTQKVVSQQEYDDQAARF